MHGAGRGRLPAGRPRLRRSGVRHHGAPLCTGARRRGNRLRALRRARPQGLTLLIATYDIERAAGIVARRLAAEGITVAGVRLDSSDLGAHIRAILDAAGQHAIQIFVSSGPDEIVSETLCRARTPINGIGVGTSLATTSDAPALDCADKLLEYAGRPRGKRREGSATWPGRKQVHRSVGPDGTLACGVVALLDEAVGGTRLLRPAMRAGRSVADLSARVQARAHAAAAAAQLPQPLR